MTNVQKQANKRHGFYIEPFMIDLDLSMTELMCYAVVYNFSKDGKSTFYGGQNYLASQINKSRSTVSEALTKLEQKGLVGKRERDFVGGFEYFVVSRSVNSKCQSTDTLSSGLETKSTPIDTHDGDKNTKASEIDPNISEKTPKEPQQNCQSTDTPFGVPNTYVGEPTSDVGTPNETSRSTELGCRQTDADNKIYINNNKLNKNESVERTHAKPPSHRSKLVQTLQFCDDGFGFESPTLQQVESYVQENGLSVNPQQFFAYYQARDWHDTNGRRIDYWQSTLQRWHYDDAKKAIQAPNKPNVADKQTVRSQRMASLVSDITQQEQ